MLGFLASIQPTNTKKGIIYGQDFVGWVKRQRNPTTVLIILSFL